MGAHCTPSVEQRSDPDALHGGHSARQDRVGAGDLVCGWIGTPLDERDAETGEAVEPRGGAAGDAPADDRYIECSHARNT